MSNDTNQLLSVYNFLGNKAGKNLGKLVHEEAVKQEAKIATQGTHLPDLKAVCTYELPWLLDFLVKFRSEEANQAKIIPEVWNLLPSRIAYYTKELQVKNQQS